MVAVEGKAEVEAENVVGDEDGEAGAGAPTSRAAHALLPIRAAPGGEGGGVAAEGAAVGDGGGGRG